MAHNVRLLSNSGSANEQADFTLPQGHNFARLVGLPYHDIELYIDSNP